VGASRAPLLLSSFDAAATFLLLRRQMLRAIEMETTDTADATAVAVGVAVLALLQLFIIVHYL